MSKIYATCNRCHGVCNARDNLNVGVSQIRIISGRCANCELSHVLEDLFKTASVTEEAVHAHMTTDCDEMALELGQWRVVGALQMFKSSLKTTFNRRWK
ncbi:hypothetical protein R1flu_015468 [Riccia fluitans]|uniref:Uncharacterized protein n=1 Tax=Riccia fluitans TaxID=41844 RepID=A0ABD1YJ60_9MARC